MSQKKEISKMVHLQEWLIGKQLLSMKPWPDDLKKAVRWFERHFTGLAFITPIRCQYLVNLNSSCTITRLMFNVLLV